MLQHHLQRGKGRADKPWSISAPIYSKWYRFLKVLKLCFHLLVQMLSSANKLDSLSSKETTVPVLRNELLTPGSTIIMRSIYHCRLADTAGQQPIHPAGPGRTRVLVYNYDQNDRHHKYSLLATYAHHDNPTIDKYRAMVTDLSLSFLKTLSCFICKYKKKECLHVCIWFRVHLAWDLKNHDKAPASS